MTQNSSGPSHKGFGINLGFDATNVGCESESMTHAAKKRLDEFDALPQERPAILTELLRRTALAPHDLPADHDLVSAADHVFSALDRQEQS